VYLFLSATAEEIRKIKSNSPGASWRRGLDRAEPLFSPQGKMQTNLRRIVVP